MSPGRTHASPQSVSVGVGVFGVLLGGALFIGSACSTFSGDATDAGATSDASDGAPAADAPVDSAVDAAAHVARFSLGCGMTRCATAGDVCCVDRGQEPPSGRSCARPKDTCPLAADQRFTCDDADDCTVLGSPGTVCCGGLGANGNSYFLLTTTCTLAENCAGSRDVVLCDRTVAGECPTGKPCEALMTFDDPATGGSGPVSPPFPACRP